MQGELPKGATILICQDEGHSKYWIGWVDQKVYHSRWGRLGTRGQAPQKTFPDARLANVALDAKTREKRNKGYQVVTIAKFRQLHAAAAVVGSANKAHSVHWYDLDVGRVVTEEQLQDPEVNPGLLLEAEVAGVRYDLILSAGRVRAYPHGARVEVSRPDPALAKALAHVAEHAAGLIL